MDVSNEHDSWIGILFSLPRTIESLVVLSTFLTFSAMRIPCVAHFFHSGSKHYVVIPFVTVKPILDMSTIGTIT